MPTEADYSKYPQEIVEAWKAWGANKFWKPGKRELDDFALFSLGWEFAKEHESSQRTMPSQPPSQRMMPPQPPQEYDSLTRQDINIIINYLARISYNTSSIIWPESSTVPSAERTPPDDANTD